MSQWHQHSGVQHWAVKIRYRGAACEAARHPWRLLEEAGPSHETDCNWPVISMASSLSSWPPLGYISTIILLCHLAATLPTNLS